MPPVPIVFDTNLYIIFGTIIFNAAIIWLLTKQNSLKLIEVANTVAEMKIQQVKDQAINSTKIDQIQNAINVIEKVERTSVELSLNIRTLQEKVYAMEKKVS